MTEFDCLKRDRDTLIAYLAQYTGRYGPLPMFERTDLLVDSVSKGLLTWAITPDGIDCSVRSPEGKPLGRYVHKNAESGSIAGTRQML